jgi:hypothetical protein
MLHDSQREMDPALRAANLALSGRSGREASRFASIELRAKTTHTHPWEVAAVVAVACAAGLIVLALWFL